MSLFFILNLLVIFIFQNCSKNTAIRFETAKISAVNSAQQPQSETPQPVNSNSTQYKSCLLSNGESVNHLYYQWGLKNNESNTRLCDLFELRQCMDGVFNPASTGFDGKTTHCDVPPIVSSGNMTNPCNLDDIAIPHGNLIIAYAAKQVSGTNNCIGQVRRCSNGVLGGTNDYSSSTCAETFAAPTDYKPLDCKLNNINIPDGSTIIAFEKADPSIECKFEVRRCLQGILSGSFSASSCNPPASM